VELIKYIIGEFSVIRGAPVSFGLSIIAVGLLLFYLMTWGYGRENSYLRTQLDDYKEKLKGATPQEARDRIDQLEKAANEVIGKRWPPLSKANADRLSENLKPIANNFRVQIMYSNALGKELAESVRDAFTNAGFTNFTFGLGGGLEPGLSVGVGSKDTLMLKSAIEGATHPKVFISRPDEAQWANLVYLSIGINTN
jgi:hypothetical protein